jgi:hypothetical protein
LVGTTHFPTCSLLYYFINFPRVTGVVKGYLVEIWISVYGKIADSFAALAFLPVVGYLLDGVFFIVPEKSPRKNLTCLKISQDFDSFV